MRLLGKMFAIVLAALWLPLTAHCALETAWLLAPHIEENGTECGEDGQHRNCATCSAVEDGGYRTQFDVNKAPAPLLLAWNDLLSIVSLDLPTTPPAAMEYDPSREPLGWIANWNFVRRVAGMPRAPALNA